MKTVYQCDFDGWYAGTADAHESPREPGVYMIPAGCVEDSPPSSDGLTPRWVGGEWVMQLKPVETVVSAQEKLAQFLAGNPDVVSLINGAQPTNV